MLPKQERFNFYMTSRTAIFLPGWGTHNTTTMFHKIFLNNLDIFTRIHCIFEKTAGINNEITTLTDDLYAHIVEKLIDKTDEFTLIGHSMGGLMAIDLIQRYPELKPHINSIITIASPLKGANKLVNIPSIFSKSANQMKQSSEFLNNLEININKLEKIPTLHISASNDLLVPIKNTYFSTTNAYQQTIPNTNHLTILLKNRTSQEINGWVQYKVYEGIDNIIKEISPQITFSNIH